MITNQIIMLTNMDLSFFRKERPDILRNWLQNLNSKLRGQINVLIKWHVSSQISKKRLESWKNKKDICLTIQKQVDDKTDGLFDCNVIDLMKNIVINKEAIRKELEKKRGNLKYVLDEEKKRYHNFKKKFEIEMEKFQNYLLTLIEETPKQPLNYWDFFTN